MTKKQIKSFVSLAVAVVVAVSGYFGGSKIISNDENAGFSSERELMIVNYFDVGQGDCEFVELPGGKCMLIDSGENEYADKVIGEIEDLGYNTIDFLVVTHPHSDHMGAMDEIIEYFDIGDIYMPEVSADTRTYEDLIETISDKGERINYTKAGRTIYQTESVDIKILSPCSNSYDDLNNYSAVIKVTYDDASFLFTGDAERPVENDMLEACYDELDSDVLKVGHHGSEYSSSADFIDAVTPELAVIECGRDNSYGHPHSSTVDRFAESEVKLYRTDELGNIKIATDGDIIKIED